jgi:hypothetical protein
MVQPQDVQVKLEAQAAERAAQITENDNLRAKLGEVLQQFETFNQLVGGTLSAGSTCLP